MCNAIYAAVVLVALIAGLTFLRIKEAKSPNAELLADLLNDKPAGTTARPDRPGKNASCSRAADFPC